MAKQPHDEIHEALLADAGWVQALARSLVGDDHAAADVAQDALTAAVEQQPSPLDGTLRGWLRGAVRHFAARRRREGRARRRRESWAARPLSGNPEEQAVERLRVHKRLTEAVLSLPEPYRLAVIGRYFDGKSPAEIARERTSAPSWSASTFTGQSPSCAPAWTGTSENAALGARRSRDSTGDTLPRREPCWDSLS